jgi:hypothetical protein
LGVLKNRKWAILFGILALLSVGALAFRETSADRHMRAGRSGGHGLAADRHVPGAADDPGPLLFLCELVSTKNVISTMLQSFIAPGVGSVSRLAVSAWLSTEF